MKVDLVEAVQEQGTSGESLARAIENYMSGDELEEFVAYLVDEDLITLEDEEEEEDEEWAGPELSRPRCLGGISMGPGWQYNNPELED